MSQCLNESEIYFPRRNHDPKKDSLSLKEIRIHITLIIAGVCIRISSALF